MRRSSFDGELEHSRHYAEHAMIRAKLAEKFPGALNIHPAHSVNDRRGTDWWVECNGHLLRCDVKVRRIDYLPRGRDDVALEIWSIDRRKVGWSRDPDKHTDFVMWFWVDTGRTFLAFFPALRNAFEKYLAEWQERFGSYRQESERNGRKWISVHIFVPRGLLTEKMVEQMGGKIGSGADVLIEDKQLPLFG